MSATIEEPPFRAELFTQDQLKVHARAIAERHKITRRIGPDRLLRRLGENAAILGEAYELINDAIAQGRRISPAAEWLLDNFYLIQEEIRTARRHLPTRYSRELPQLQNGPSAGQPRVYHLALELIAHLDGRIDAEVILDFVASYQQTTVLKLGELWAVPIMLRLALIEYLRRIAELMIRFRGDRNLANEWAERMLATAQAEPSNLVLVLADMARSKPPLSSAFVAEFSRLLQGKHHGLGLPLAWLEQQLAGQSVKVDEMLHQETQRQAADQISIGNSIASLRALGAIDWRTFVESSSAVEQVLQDDPAGVYPAMDFASRDRYRHAVEDLAKRSRQSEPVVAMQAVALAKLGAKHPGWAQWEGHVGYYLVDDGRSRLESELKAGLPVGRRFGRWVLRWPLSFYLSFIFAVTAGVMTVFIRAWNFDTFPTWAWLAGGFVLALCLSHLAITTANWLASLFVPPQPLPRLDFSKGIPPECRTVVAVPTMLASERAVTDLLESLEVRFLANLDPQLYYALLTDFRDAPEEKMPDDGALLDLACRGIEALNAKHAHLQANAFLLCHRPRRWNESESRWMGYERKRGKLAEFNALLQGRPTGDFTTVIGEVGLFKSIRFVITLDSDTELPRDSARQLVATMAHPLVRPVFDPAIGRVSRGYGVLQPRVAVSLPSANRSWFSRFFAGEPGIDPYTRLVSDVYQDLFGEGSFIGKGIYEVGVFGKILDQRFPSNRILSHDLLEGCYVRAGLISDVQLYEEQPWHYTVDAARRHRWIRGDWQIASWLLPRVPGPDARRTSNPLSGLSRWKILDNLRRSGVPVALLGLFLMAWLVVAKPWIATAMVLAVIFFPALLIGLTDLLRRPKDVPLNLQILAMFRHLGRHLGQLAFTLIFLPYDVGVSLDAIGRTLWRLIVTRKHLLQWQTASDAQGQARSDLGSFFRTMAIAPMFGVGLGALLWSLRPESLIVAAPVLALWLVSPVIAWGISRPLEAKAARLTQEQLKFLRRQARRTWAFFDTMIGAEDNFLPPDNYQEYPVGVVAHRTSPTNLGMGLLSTLSAYDFGYIGALGLAERVGRTVQTMQKLERYRGHFYNWYDTRTLQILPAPYISTVDSGNLTALLLTLRQGLLELAEHPTLPSRAIEGLQDALFGLQERLQSEEAPEKLAPSPVVKRARVQVEEMLADLEQAPASLQAFFALLRRFGPMVESIAQALSTQPDEILRVSVEALSRQCRELRDEFLGLAPWIEVMASGMPQEILSGDEAGAASWRDLAKALRLMDETPSIRPFCEVESELTPVITNLLGEASLIKSEETRAWLKKLQEAIQAASQRCKAHGAALKDLADRCLELARADFSFLYDECRKHMVIGYNVPDKRRDGSFYDLLASEARLASFVGIALGQIPQEHWFALGRRLTSVGGRPVLFSWSGSMFEYLMPLIVMPNYPNTLLDHTCTAAVRRQIQYGHEREVPWGISESGYNVTDAQLNYQYRSFGVPGLGFKRGLADDLVVAPYASVMALMVDAPKACQNLERLKGDGLLGRYGFYEAVDYTPRRLRSGENRAVVQSFMAHHQGMNMLSLACVLLGAPMQRRFLAEPFFRATDLLLQERVPDTVRISLPAVDGEPSPMRTAPAEMPTRIYRSANTPMPEVQLLSNAHYHVMISAAGSGYSRWNDLAVTRWREDPTRDCWGTYCYIRDLRKGAFWSATHQPTLKPAESYEANFQQSRAEFRRRDYDIATHTEISVAPEDDVELRRITLTNHSRERRVIELTSYAEVVLAQPAADSAHPAFSNLFVQTQILREDRAILCTRRPRASTENPPWMFHLMAVQGDKQTEPSFETDRSRFIGRGRTLEYPLAMDNGQLSESQGAVLDPIVAVRQTLVLEPEETVSIGLVTGVAASRQGALDLVSKYRELRAAERVFEMAFTMSQLTRRQLNVNAAEAELFEQLAGALVHPSRLRRADPAILTKNRRPQSALWSYAISGDLPIVLLRISDQANIELIRKTLQAHAFWRRKGVAVDLVIWNEDFSGYRQALQDQIIGLIQGGPEPHMLDRPGGIFVRRGEQISNEDQILLQTVARIVLSDKAGSLAAQVDRRLETSPELPRLVPQRRRSSQTATGKTNIPSNQPSLLFFNGQGGFTADGREYIITVQGDQPTPAPWVNVIANPTLGMVVSESGSVYTWAENAHEYRLTTWSNDPVSDGTGEAFYIRDEENGEFWSPTPLPARGRTPYTTRHGMGYSVFEHTEGGVRSELHLYAAPAAPVKFAVVRIFNQSGRTRRLSVTGYWEWVLGELRGRSLMHVVTEIDPETKAIFARNAFNTDFCDRVAFVDVNASVRTVTGDRTEFIGRNGTPANPAALGRTRLAGNMGAGLDPCAAIQVPFELADQAQGEWVFILGAGKNTEEARQLVQRHRSAQAAREALEGVWTLWNDILGAVRVETPDPTVNLLANVWLPYQTLACRMWARSGFYQSGGAFGFRDQLQDAMALVHHRPQTLRDHLLLCASRQFPEGDVQHWWHPPGGRGVRTHFSDDFLWLPLATCRYIKTTGDTGVLKESAPFLEGRPVPADEEAYYDMPARSEVAASLYDHCVRAVEHGLRFGAHGLPLMGGGDWNDGMNLVGKEGRGESVWLAFFLYDVLNQFAEIAHIQGDLLFARRCVTEAMRLKGNIEHQAWDGQWYRRAYFDNGEPLGSAANPECQIDALPQSWAVISGAGDPVRQAQAMAAVNARLVRPEAQLIQLFAPPFDQSPQDPGYIKGYVPGVRENGGQYTHAAIWTTMAFALLGEHQRAWELFAMINPLHHGENPEEVRAYKVEPYVVAADVYAVAPHTGRGGWTWYTGSAGWMCRLIVETLLGLVRMGSQLYLTPRIPESWPGYTLHYRYHQTTYHITLKRTEREIARITIDGVVQPNGSVPLVDDQREHQVQIEWPTANQREQPEPRVTQVPEEAAAARE